MLSLVVQMPNEGVLKILTFDSLCVVQLAAVLHVGAPERLIRRRRAWPD